MDFLQNMWTVLTHENILIINIQGCLFSFIEAYISMLIFTSLFNIKSTKKAQIIYVITFSVLGSISRFLIPDPYGSILNLLICPILIILIFKISVLKAIISEFIPSLLFIIIDTILLKIGQIIINLTSYQVLYIPIYKICFSIIEYLTLFLLYLIIKKVKLNLNSFDNISRKQKIILYVNFSLGIFTIITQTIITAYYSHSLPILIIILSVSSLIIYFLISFYSLISTNKLNIAKQNLEETRLMNKTLTELNDKIRAFRHDFNNIIQALGGYIQSKDYDGLENYYSQLLKDCQEVNNLTALNNETINNPAIYSLIASKYYLAQSQNIIFNIEVVMDLNTINMKIYEFCRILGILLDNAIQASTECDKKKMNVIIRNDNRNNRQLLIIENTYKDKNINTEKIYEKGYSTKEGNTGLGLWEVRQILSKNNNLNLFTKKDDKYFTQQLEIYNN